MPDPNKTKALLTALKSADSKEKIDTILSSIDDLNQQVDGKGNTLLHLAAEQKLYDVALALIYRGASVNATDHKIRIPLHYACMENNLSWVKFMLSKGANANAIDINGHTPLHFICNAAFGENRNNVLIAVELLKHKPCVDAIGKGRLTPLFLASQNSKPETIRLLLEAGADPGFETSVTQTLANLPVMKARQVLKKHPVCKEMSEAALSRIKLAKIEYETEKGNSYTSTAVEPVKTTYTTEGIEKFFYDCEDSSQLEETTNRDLNRMVDRDGDTLLHYALYQGREELVKYLVNRGVSLHLVNHAGQAPLHYLCAFKILQTKTGIAILNQMLSRFADANAADHHGNTPLHFLCCNEIDSSVAVPVEKSICSSKSRMKENFDYDNSDSEQLGNQGDITSAGTAVDSEYLLTAASTLINGGAGVDFLNSENKTPLYFACMKNKHRLVNHLLALGANPRLGEEKNTPYDMAKSIENFPETIVSEMGKYGKPKSTKDSSRNLILSVASNQNLPENPTEKELIARLNSEGKDLSSYTNEEGNTLLHAAATDNQIQLLHYIRGSFQIDLNVRNVLGRTPLHYACMHPPLLLR